MSEPRPSPGSAPGRVLAVVGASGGVGTTTLVAAVGAQVVRGGRSCAVVDLQRGGGGLDVPYAVEHLPGVRWVDLAHVDGPVDGAALLPRLPSAGGVRVLAHAREPGPVPGPTSCAEVIDGLRANVDSVVLDAPRDLPRDAIHAQFSSAVDVVVHMRRADGTRIVDSVGVVKVSSAGVPRVVPALVCPGHGAPDRSAQERLATLCGVVA